jgi:hypothetical protein
MEMPTSFLGLFAFSTALSLIATLAVVGLMRVVRHFRLAARRGINL